MLNLQEGTNYLEFPAAVSQMFFMFLLTQQLLKSYDMLSSLVIFGYWSLPPVDNRGLTVLQLGQDLSLQLLYKIQCVI